MGFQVPFKPVPLRPGFRKVGVENLGVDHDEVTPPAVEAVPGGPETGLIPLQGPGRDGPGGHGGIGFVAHVVIAGNMDHLHVHAVQPRPRLVDRLQVAPGLGVLLHQVAHVHDEVRAQRGRQPEGRVRSGRLLATRLEFQRLAAGIEHVVGIAQNHELEFRGRQQRTVETHFPSPPSVTVVSIVSHAAMRSSIRA